jgi:hypothetical protein
MNAFVSCLFATLLLCSLAGCGGGKTSTDSAPPLDAGAMEKMAEVGGPAPGADAPKTTP